MVWIGHDNGQDASPLSKYRPTSIKMVACLELLPTFVSNPFRYLIAKTLRLTLSQIKCHGFR